MNSDRRPSSFHGCPTHAGAWAHAQEAASHGRSMENATARRPALVFDPLTRHAALRIWITAAFLADLISTGIAFSLGAVEANPVMAGWSIYRIAAAKLSVLAAVLLIRKPGAWATAVLLYGALATSAVVAWNLSQFWIAWRAGYF